MKGSLVRLDTDYGLSRKPTGRLSFMRLIRSHLSIPFAAFDRYVSVPNGLERVSFHAAESFVILACLVVLLSSSGCSWVTITHCARWNLLPAFGITYSSPVCDGGQPPVTKTIPVERL